MRFDKMDVSGKFWLQEIDTISGYPHLPSDEGRLVYAKAEERAYKATSSEWKLLTTDIDVLQVGTKVLFGFAPLPTNWTITTSPVARLVNLTNTTSQIGTTNDGEGQWAITGLQNSGSHTHLQGIVPSIPPPPPLTPLLEYLQALITFNNHANGAALGKADSNARTGKSDVHKPANAIELHTHNLGTAGSHSHTFDGSWRPPMIFFAEGTYDPS